MIYDSVRQASRKNLIRLQLSQNSVLKSLDLEAMAELERHLEVSDLKNLKSCSIKAIIKWSNISF